MKPLQYRLLRRLEGGALSELFEATTDAGSTVVLKLFPSQYSDPAYGRRILETARVLNPIDAPALLRYLEVGVVQRRLAVVRESVDGFSLGAALSRLNTREVVLPSAIALFWVVELLDAVERAHQAGLVHGAITPGNVLVTKAGEIRVCDFGALQALQSTPALRKAFGGDTGRSSYRAPEILKNEPPTAESDVYSIGALAYELLTLREPASSKGPGMSTRREALPPPSRIDRRLNSRLDPILMRALEPVPGRRFRSCAEFSQSLRRFLSENGGIPNADDLRRCGVELAPPPVATGPLPFTEPFTLTGLEGGALEPLPERTVVFAARPSFSGGELRIGEFPEDAETVEAPPGFADFPVEPPRPSAPKEEPQFPDTDPGHAGPFEQGWEAPPGTAIYKPKRKDPERSIVGPAPQRHPRVKVIEDFHDVLEGEAPKPAPREDPRPTARARVDPERSRVRPALHAHEESSISTSGHRPLRTDERRLIAAMKKNQRLLIVVSVIALCAALGFSGAIWQLHRERARRAAPPVPRSIAVETPAETPVAPRPPAPHPVVHAEPPPPPVVKPAPPKPVDREIALDEPPPRRSAGFLTIRSNVAAHVFIDGALVRGHTPLVRYPVRPGQRLVVLEAIGTRDRRVFNVTVARGKLRKIEELDLAAPPR